MTRFNQLLAGGRRHVVGLRGLSAIALAVVLLAGACGVRPGDQTAGGNPATATSQPGTSAGGGSATPDPGSTNSGTARTSPSASPTPKKTPKPKPAPPAMLLDSILPSDGVTVGVAMPIIVVFTDPVKASARKGIEKAMKLTASTPVVGSWHWFTNRQVEFRPKKYWPAGDRVTLDAEFTHVKDGYGREGTHAYVHKFTIGEDFETKISVTRHTTKVYSNHKLLTTFSSDAGSPDFPSWDGTMAVSEKDRNVHMTSCSAGITCNKKSPNWYDGYYPWAVRLTWSGTFVHYSSSDPKPGHSYGSHGCVHLSLAAAKWYFNHVNIGDPVTITGSPRGPADATNGYAAYNLSWTQWLSKSYLGSIKTA